MCNTTLWLFFFFYLQLLLSCCFGALQYEFYKGKCGSFDVEDIVNDVVSKRCQKDPTTSAALLHMLFHDCFVNGCDASLLLDGKDSEKTAFPSFTVRGYDVIDEAKAAVEALCPGLVSCADIVVLATRDSVLASGGGKYKVKTGRRDGIISLAKNVDLPPPFISMQEAISRFAAKGLNVQDMVHLLGSHTVGVAHCSSFKDRLYNFTGTGKPDPAMNPLLLRSLKHQCPQNAKVDNTANLDQNLPSSTIIDNSYYQQILMNKGVVQFDQVMSSHHLTKPTVTALAAGPDFSKIFGEAVAKMSNIEVLTDMEGEIRYSCRARNKHI